MELTYREDYFDDVPLRRTFIAFLNTVFGLDLTRWEAAGYWSANYHAFSFFAGDNIVSSVCLYSMNLIVGGRECRVAQLSGVGTLPQFRKQGLNRQLTANATTWAEPHHDFFFLFSTPEAIAFYQKCGFRGFTESKTRMTLQGQTAQPVAVQLDMDREDHRELAFRLASTREPVSDILGAMNPRLFMYWCLYGLMDSIYYIADLDALVLFKRENGLVKVFDIVSPRMPDFKAVYPYISDSTDRIAEFLFVPDKLGLGELKSTPMDSVSFDENETHLLGDFPLEREPVMFPHTAHA